MLDEPEKGTLFTVFEDERYADWNPAYEPRTKGFVDRQIAAATAVLTGEPYYPRIVGLQGR